MDISRRSFIVSSTAAAAGAALAQAEAQPVPGQNPQAMQKQRLPPDRSSDPVRQAPEVSAVLPR